MNAKMIEFSVETAAYAVVQVLRVLTVDRDYKSISQVHPAGLFLFAHLAGNGRNFIYNSLGELNGNSVRADNSQNIGRGIVDMSDDIDNMAFGILALSAEIGDLNLDLMAADGTLREAVRDKNIIAELLIVRNNKAVGLGALEGTDDV